MEYEFRLPRHSVWLGTSDGEHERDLRIPGRQCGPDSDSLARSATDRSPGSAPDRARQRPHLGTTGPPAPVLPDRRHSQFADTYTDASEFRIMDGRRSALDP